MKTALLTVALIAFSLADGYAQNSACPCRKTAAHHKKAHHLPAVAAAPAKNENQTCTKPQDESCYTYTKDNIVVTECPATIYPSDYNGEVSYMAENNYLGYYPSEVNSNITESVAPMSNNLIVSSSAFSNGGDIPQKYTCEGEQASPPLSITNIPIGTKSLALEVFDPNATTNGGVTYWLAWDIDTTGNIPENFISNHQSMNLSDSWGYQGVCPLRGTHYYHFAVYALDTRLLADKRTTKAALDRDMRGHILAAGEMIGVYNKHDQ